MRTLLAGLLLCVLVHHQLRAQSVTEQSGQKDIQRLKNEMSLTKRRLDSLRRAQESLNRTMTRTDEQAQADAKVISRLTTQLDQLSRNETNLHLDQDSAATELRDARDRFLMAISTYYRRSRMVDHHLLSLPGDEMSLARQLRYVRDIAAQEHDAVNSHQTDLAEVEAALVKLTSQRSNISELQRRRQTSLALTQARRLKQEQALRNLRKHSTDAADKLVTLKQAADEMEALLSRLQRERSAAPPTELALAPGEFPRLMGRLSAPLRGTIVTPYGALQDSVTGIRSFSPGITIRGKGGAEIVSIASGQVVYAGELRGYGEFVIVQHDADYFSTYAGLGEILVTRGAMVESGSVIGSAREDGFVKFELRKGREPLDPVAWLRLDSF